MCLPGRGKIDYMIRTWVVLAVLQSCCSSQGRQEQALYDGVTYPDILTTYLTGPNMKVAYACKARTAPDYQSFMRGYALYGRAGVMDDGPPGLHLSDVTGITNLIRGCNILPEGKTLQEFESGVSKAPRVLSVPKPYFTDSVNQLKVLECLDKHRIGREEAHQYFNVASNMPNEPDLTVTERRQLYRTLYICGVKTVPREDEPLDVFYDYGGTFRTVNSIDDTPAVDDDAPANDAPANDAPANDAPANDAPTARQEQAAVASVDPEPEIMCAQRPVTDVVPIGVEFIGPQAKTDYSFIKITAEEYVDLCGDYFDALPLERQERLQAKLTEQLKEAAYSRICRLHRDRQLPFPYPDLTTLNEVRHARYREAPYGARIRMHYDVSYEAEVCFGNAEIYKRKRLPLSTDEQTEEETKGGAITALERRLLSFAEIPVRLRQCYAHSFIDDLIPIQDASDAKLRNYLDWCILRLQQEWPKRKMSPWIPLKLGVLREANVDSVTACEQRGRVGHHVAEVYRRAYDAYSRNPIAYSPSFEELSAFSAIPASCFAELNGVMTAEVNLWLNPGAQWLVGRCLEEGVITRKERDFMWRFLNDLGDDSVDAEERLTRESLQAIRSISARCLVEEFTTGAL